MYDSKSDAMKAEWWCQDQRGSLVRREAFGLGGPPGRWPLHASPSSAGRPWMCESLLAAVLEREYASHCPPQPSGVTFGWVSLLSLVLALLLLGWCAGVACAAGAWLSARKWAARLWERSATPASASGGSRRLEGYRA